MASNESVYGQQDKQRTFNTRALPVSFHPVSLAVVFVLIKTVDGGENITQSVDPVVVVVTAAAALYSCERLTLPFRAE